MKDDTLRQQAAELESLLPRVWRRLFALDPDHPASDLPVAQLRVCSILRTGPRSMSALGKELGISFSAATQIADRLERAGHVERVAKEGDRRVKNLRLTASGTEMMESRRKTRVRRVEEVLEQIPPEMRQTVLRALNRLLEAAEASPR